MGGTALTAGKVGVWHAMTIGDIMEVACLLEMWDVVWETPVFTTGGEGISSNSTYLWGKYACNVLYKTPSQKVGSQVVNRATQSYQDGFSMHSMCPSLFLTWERFL